MKSKKYVIYLRQCFVWMKMMKIMKIKKKLEITVITQANLEDLLTASEI